LKPAIMNQTAKSPSKLDVEEASFYKLNSTSKGAKETSKKLH